MSTHSLDMTKPLKADTDSDEGGSPPCFRLPIMLFPFLWTQRRKLAETDEALKHMALEISNDDCDYPHQVSVGNGSSAILSCSTLAESSEGDVTVEIHRCTSCTFRVSVGWRFCPECGMYIDGVVTTHTINTLDVTTMLESNVETPKREESFMVEDLLDELE